jgi:hypothetical protein
MMNKSYIYNEAITNYLYNDMSEPEKVAFEERLKQDSELAAEVERQKNIFAEIQARLVHKEAMEDEHYDELNQLAKEVIAKRQANGHQQPVSNKKTRPIWYYLAASAAVILVLILSRNAFQNPSSEQLFLKYYESFTFDQVIVRGSSTAEVVRYKSIHAYSNGNIENAIANLSQLVEHGELNDETSFCLGLAYMAEEDYNSAQLELNRHLKSYSRLQNEAKWYLGLCYLQLNQLEKAESILYEIDNSNSEISKQAKRLVSRIQKIED